MIFKYESTHRISIFILRESTLSPEWNKPSVNDVCHIDALSKPHSMGMNNRQQQVSVLDSSGDLFVRVQAPGFWPYTWAYFLECSPVTQLQDQGIGHWHPSDDDYF